jgi:hypothetical protein
MPAVTLIAAIGIAFVVRKITDRLAKNRSDNVAVRNGVFAAVLVIVTAIPLIDSIRVSPHYRLYTNVLGGGMAEAGNYFPHDEFFDSRLGEAMNFVAANAAPGARVYSETANLTEFHLHRLGRDDIKSVWLSDPSELEQMRPGDVVIDARGRRYLSNDALLKRLAAISMPAKTVSLGEVPAADVYFINEQALTVFR